MEWKTAEYGEKPGLIRSIAQAAPGLRLDPENCFLDTLSLPFYPEGRLLKLSGTGVQDPPRWYARVNGETVALDGGVSAITYCNAIAPLSLSNDTAYPYARFYYYFSGGAQVFEAQIKRSAVGYTGRIWLYARGDFFEMDVNVTSRGVVTELEKTAIPAVADFRKREFWL